MAGLTNVVYLPLMFKDCKYDTINTSEHYNFRWNVPSSLQARKAPVCYMSLLMVAIEGTNTNALQSLFVRMNNIYSENVLMNEVNSPFIGGTILALLDFRGNTDHYATLYESNPKIQLGTNLAELSFDLVDGEGNIVRLSGAKTHSINFILKIEYPEHNEVRDITLKNYAQSVVGNPPFNRL